MSHVDISEKKIPNQGKFQSPAAGGACPECQRNSKEASRTEAERGRKEIGRDEVREGGRLVQSVKAL